MKKCPLQHANIAQEAMVFSGASRPLECTKVQQFPHLVWPLCGVAAVQGRWPPCSPRLFCTQTNETLTFTACWWANTSHSISKGHRPRTGAGAIAFADAPPVYFDLLCAACCVCDSRGPGVPWEMQKKNGLQVEAARMGPWTLPWPVAGRRPCHSKIRSTSAVQLVLQRPEILPDMVLAAARPG